MTKNVERTLEGLKRNRMNAYYVKDSKELHAHLSQLISKDTTVSVGGSMTLFETHTIDWLRSQPLHFLDRYQEGLSAEAIKELFRKSFFADAYLCSSNAITENGELYNVDGNGNRVAALTYGPDKVIVIAGTNKIVKDIPQAIARNRAIAAPLNCVRLKTNTPCTLSGKCEDCLSPSRICCTYVITGFQRNPNRIHVFLIEGSYGY